MDGCTTSHLGWWWQSPRNSPHHHPRGQQRCPKGRWGDDIEEDLLRKSLSFAQWLSLWPENGGSSFKSTGICTEMGFSDARGSQDRLRTAKRAQLKGKNTPIVVLKGLHISQEIVCLSGACQRGVALASFAYWEERVHWVTEQRQPCVQCSSWKGRQNNPCAAP